MCVILKGLRKEIVIVVVDVNTHDSNDSKYGRDVIPKVGNINWMSRSGRNVVC